MQKLLARTPIFALCFVFFIEQAAFAAPSVAVVPLLDSSSDTTSKELAASFYDALKLRGVEVVDTGIVEASVNYSQSDEGRDACAEGVKLLSESKEKYFELEQNESFALAAKAVELFEAAGIATCGSHLRDAHIVCGIAIGAQKMKESESSAYFQKAVLVDPSFELSERDFPPTIVRKFSSAKNEIIKKSTGALSVDASPKVADVFVNGIFKGVAPLTLNGLPDGTYNVAVRANNYVSEEREITINNGGNASAEFSLKWKSNAKNKSDSKRKEAKNAILEGVRVSNVLNVEKVVTVDADVNDDMSGVANIQMVDREYQAGYKKIQVSWDASRSELASSLSNATDLLVKQLGFKVTKSPQKYLDGEGSGSVVMLGKKRNSLSNGALIGIAGGVAAAIGGGIAWSLLAGGGGGGAQSGSLNVRFK